MIFDFFVKRKIRRHLDDLLENPHDAGLSDKLLSFWERKPRPFEAVMHRHADEKGWLMKFFDEAPDDTEHRKKRLENQARETLKWEEFIRLLKAPETGARKKWIDSSSNRTVDPLLLERPKSLQDIQQIVQAARSKGVKVRAYGSKHSVSDVAITTDYMIDTGGFGYPLHLDRSLLKAGPADNELLFETQAGITIQELTFALECIDLALPNMGGSNVQTFLGAASTGTHGSGIDLGNYADLIQSLVLVAGDGNIYRVEPTDGISDPSKYPLDGVTLIQDDDKFHSTTVSMGSMGIIYSVIIAVKKFYYLKENRTMTTWEDLKPSLVDGKAVGGARDFEVLINPFKIDGKNSCIVVNREEVLKNGKPQDLGTVKPSGHRNVLESFVSHFKFFTEILIAMMNTFPKEVPKFLEKALKGQQDKNYIDKWYKVLNQGLNQVKNFGTAVELGFPVEQGEADGKTIYVPAEGSTNYVEATEEIMQLVQELASEETRQYISSPISLRFVNKSKAYMAPMYDQYTCMIEVPVLHKVYGSFEIMERIERAMIKRGCRPHWGLNMDELNAAQVADLYPKTPEFIETRHFFDADGLFNNSFTNRIGI